MSWSRYPQNATDEQIEAQRLQEIANCLKTGRYNDDGTGIDPGANDGT